MSESKRSGMVYKIIIGIMVIAAVLVGINFWLNARIAENFSEGMVEGMQESLDDEEVEMVQGDFASSVLQGAISGQDLKYSHQQGDVYITNLDVDMTTGEMIALINEDEVDQYLLNLEDFSLVLNDLAYHNNFDHELTSIEEIKLTYSGQADIDAMEWSFDVGMEINNLKMNLMNSGEVTEQELQEMRQLLGLDLREMGFNRLNLKMSTDELFPGQEDELVELTVDEFDFEADHFLVNSYFDLGYDEFYDELEIYDSNIYLELASSELREGLEFLAYMYGMPLDFEGNSIELSPTGPIDNLQWY